MKLDILVFAVHPDDAELGCSGTILKHIAAGKKAGIVDLTRGELGTRGTAETRDDEAAVSAKTLYGLDSNIKFEKLYDISREVLAIGKFQIAPSKPIIGERAFTRESGMGVDLIKTQPLALFGITPEWVGQVPQYVLGKKSGKASVEMKLDDLGMPALAEDQKDQVLLKIKTLSLKKKGLVEDDEFVAIVKEVTG